MNCIITQLNHISTIPSVLSRRPGCTTLIKVSPTNPMAAGTAQAQEDLIPPHFVLWGRNTSQPAGNSHWFCRNQFHWILTFLLEFCFDYFIILFTLKTIDLHYFFSLHGTWQNKVIAHSTLPKKRKCKSYTQHNCCSWLLIAVSDSSSRENSEYM